MRLERLERAARRGLQKDQQKDPPAVPPGASRTRTKRALCLEFSRQGRCTHGARCIFAHGAHQLADVAEKRRGSEDSEQAEGGPKARHEAEHGAGTAVDALFARLLAE